MCAGGIINARIGTVRYGAKDDKAGACGSVLNLFEERFNHRPRLYRGPMEAECGRACGPFSRTCGKKTDFRRRFNPFVTSAGDLFNKNWIL